MEVEETGLELNGENASAAMFYDAEMSSGTRSYCARLKERSAEYFRSHPELLEMISESSEDGESSSEASSSEDEYLSESEDEEMEGVEEAAGTSEENCIVIEDDIDELIASQDKVFAETKYEDADENQYEEMQRLICDGYTALLNEVTKAGVDTIRRFPLPQPPLVGQDEASASSSEGPRVIEKFLKEVYASFKTPALQAWQMDKVEEIKEAPKSKVLSNIGSYTLSGAEFSTLLPCKWLNDEIINSYFELIAERSEKLASVFKVGIPRCIMLNSFFYTKLKGGGGYNYSRVARWTRKYTDLFGYDKILIPINQPSHWVLVVVNFVTKTVGYYDSLYGEDPTCTEYILRWLGDEWADKYKSNPKYKDCNPRTSKWAIEYPKDIPRQRNGYDCGVFTCKNAECLSRSDSINFTQKDTPHIRDVMMYELYKGKLLLDPTDISSKYI